MIGEPKYKRGDVVTFKLEDDGQFLSGTGEIVQVDEFGCFADESDVCYDIVTQEERYKTEINKKGECCYKHVNEGSIVELVKEA